RRPRLLPQESVALGAQLTQLLFARHIQRLLQRALPRLALGLLPKELSALTFQLLPFAVELASLGQELLEHLGRWRRRRLGLVQLSCRKLGLSLRTCGLALHFAHAPQHRQALSHPPERVAIRPSARASVQLALFAQVLPTSTELRQLLLEPLHVAAELHHIGVELTVLGRQLAQ